MKGALKGGKQVLMGNHAVAVGAALSRAQVVAAYPITPQTQVVELLAEMHAEGSFTGRFMRVESEHSAMAALIGASTAGARTFTASSSQGLAYMHEMLHWAAGARLPIVMANVNRALGAPWILWTDQTDSLSQRDTGWMQVYCASTQEVLDSVIMSYKVSERLMVPTMVVLDGFILSHTYEPIEVPEQEAVDRFLPALKARDPLMTSRPRTYGSLPTPKDFFRLRRRLAADMDSALGVIEEVGAEFGKAFGRSYGLFEAYRCEDAEAVLVTSGSAAQTALEAVDELRKQGRKAGNLRMRLPALSGRGPAPLRQARGPADCGGPELLPGTAGHLLRGASGRALPAQAPPARLRGGGRPGRRRHHRGTAQGDLAGRGRGQA